jgi:hypothetical protein
MYKHEHKEWFAVWRAEFCHIVGREPDAFEEYFVRTHGDVPIYAIDWWEFRLGLRAWLRKRLPAVLFKDVGDLFAEDEDEEER